MLDIGEAIALEVKLVNEDSRLVLKGGNMVQSGPLNCVF